MKKLSAVVAALAAIGLVACGGGAKNEPATGSVALSISGPESSNLQSALKQAIGEPNAAARITSVNLWADGLDAACLDGWYATLPYAPTFPITDTLTKMPSCRYVFHATAVDSAGTVLYEASAPITVSDRQMSVLNLVLQQKVAPGTVTVVAPKVSGIAITGTYPPVIGKPVHLAAAVTASPTPTYQWTVSCPGDLTFRPFSASNSKVTDLTLSFCESDATVTFSVTDPSVPETGGSITSTVSFVLPYVKQGTEVDGITLNSFPNITSIRATTNAQPLPGGTVDLVAVASDPDGDNLVYAWSDNCGGSFSGGDTLTPVWTAPNSPGAACTLTLTVDEDDSNAVGHTAGTNSATIKLNVAAPIWTATTWLYPDSSATGSTVSWLNGVLTLTKTDPATAPGLAITGPAMPLSSLAFDVTGYCGAGAPRFNAYFAGGVTCFFGCAYGTHAGSSVVFGASDALCTGGIPMPTTAPTGIDIVMDEVGATTLTNVKVNGTLVTP